MSDSSSSDESSGDERAFFKQRADEAPQKKLSQAATKGAPASDEKSDESDASSDENDDNDDNDDENDDLTQQAHDKTHATIYVEGMSYDADESALVSHFSSCGTVREVRLPRYQDSGRPRGYAHVVFDSEASAKKALALDGKYLLKRYLTIRPAETPRGMDQARSSRKNVKITKGCRTVFIKQLPYDVDEATVKEALSSCGDIVSVRLPLWNHTKKLKGFGYVEFADEASAVEATKKSGMKIGSRMVLIDLDTGAPKASFRNTDGQYWSKGQEGKTSLAKRMAEKRKKPAAANAKHTKKPKL
ncbi:unnamed protein product [Aphanomyces euteiches]|uniref:RRM domain-containing protein n=1 Tax=Aphanomyces euteiches TaxID=100861 RepID=A0A6G0WFD1_9STRA|nr:hypothetical protein Ae201684_015568 [Aphanomyces euteiches]KAH9084057.1 hypothetical protein Ae201684P_020318 [Aphanomyces euteiches]KAH9144653.1 hypothetical protein AeRB84_011411 [Aphanomyces euteiches]